MRSLPARCVRSRLRRVLQSSLRAPCGMGRAADVLGRSLSSWPFVRLKPLFGMKCSSISCYFVKLCEERLVLPQVRVFWQHGKSKSVSGSLFLARPGLITKSFSSQVWVKTMVFWHGWSATKKASLAWKFCSSPGAFFRAAPLPYDVPQLLNSTPRCHGGFHPAFHRAPWFLLSESRRCPQSFRVIVLNLITNIKQQMFIHFITRFLRNVFRFARCGCAVFLIFFFLSLSLSHTLVTNYAHLNYQLVSHGIWPVLHPTYVCWCPTLAVA